MKEIRTFEEIFRTYYPHLLLFVERQVSDYDLAKDIVQDVFFKLYETDEEAQTIENIKSWLYKVSRNAALDYLRHLKVHDNNRLLMAESMIYAAEVDERISEELASKINVAINSLPEQCRQIIRMSVLENRKYQDIALELHVSVNTVKKQISRGYKKLRESLFDDFHAMVLLFYSFHSPLYLIENEHIS